MLTLGTLANSTLPSKVNQCKGPKFTEMVNRAEQWLTELGDWWGSTRPAIFCLQRCGAFVTPACVANVEGVRACDRALRIESPWYEMLPYFNPACASRDGVEFWFEYYDQVPTFEQICVPCRLRVFPANLGDVGKTIKFIGYDQNKLGIRTLQNGVYQDGEVVTLAKPWVDTVSQFSSVTAVLKQVSNDSVRVFQIQPAGLLPLADYEAWETHPDYQRYRVRNRRHMEEPFCCRHNTVEAIVKLAHVPVVNDDDTLLIGNRIAMEQAIMAIKALDDSNPALADALMFGSAANTRIGAVPALQQELRSHTGDRFAATVRVHGTADIGRHMIGFI